MSLCGRRSYSFVGAESSNSSEASRVTIDDSSVFTDTHMNPNEFAHLQQRRRRRRHAFLDGEASQRRKRALSTYEFYPSEPVMRKRRSQILSDVRHLREKKRMTSIELI